MELLQVTELFASTAVLEIVGRYQPWLVLRQGKPMGLLLPVALALAAVCLDVAWRRGVQATGRVG